MPVNQVSGELERVIAKNFSSKGFLRNFQNELQRLNQSTILARRVHSVLSLSPNSVVEIPELSHTSHNQLRNLLFNLYQDRYYVDGVVNIASESEEIKYVVHIRRK